MVLVLSGKVIEEHFSILLALLGNSFNASCLLVRVVPPPEAIDNSAHKGVAVSLECCDECALTTLCITNDAACLLNGKREG